MCGYVGFINNKNLLKDKKHIIYKMMNRIKHRGPDGEGTYIDDNIAIGFKRLSIIGLNDGCQPIYNEDRNLVLVFNGEIYNYRELKQKLIEKGHKFYTHSDSEVLIHLYESYKEKMLNYLRGMFSFCIWDKKQEILFLARDFFGIKPLYYGKINNTFFFWLRN